MSGYTSHLFLWKHVIAQTLYKLLFKTVQLDLQSFISSQVTLSVSIGRSNSKVTSGNWNEQFLQDHPTLGSTELFTQCQWEEVSKYKEISRPVEGQNSMPCKAKKKCRILSDRKKKSSFQPSSLR